MNKKRHSGGIKLMLVAFSISFGATYAQGDKVEIQSPKAYFDGGSFSCNIRIEEKIYFLEIADYEFTKSRKMTIKLSLEDFNRKTKIENGSQEFLSVLHKIKGIQADEKSEEAWINLICEQLNDSGKNKLPQILGFPKKHLKYNVIR